MHGPVARRSVARAQQGIDELLPVVSGAESDATNSMTLVCSVVEASGEESDTSHQVQGLERKGGPTNDGRPERRDKQTRITLTLLCAPSWDTYFWIQTRLVSHDSTLTVHSSPNSQHPSFRDGLCEGPSNGRNTDLGDGQALRVGFSHPRQFGGNVSCLQAGVARLLSPGRSRNREVEGLIDSESIRTRVVSGCRVGVPAARRRASRPLSQ